MSDHFEQRRIGIFDAPANRALISELKANGRDRVVLPMPEIAAAGNGDELKENLAGIAGFDSVVVTDEFAAEALISMLVAAGVDTIELDAVVVCALGESVADRLRYSLIHSDVVPSRIDAQSVAKAVAEYAGGLDGASIAVAGPKHRCAEIGDALAAEGASVVAVPLYAFEFPELDARQRALISGGAVEEMVFASPRDVAAFDLLRALLGTSFETGDVAISAAGEAAYGALLERGFRPLYFKV